MFPCTASFHEGNNLAFGFGCGEGLGETRQRGGIDDINLTAPEQGFCTFGGDNLNDKVRGLSGRAYPELIGSEDHLLTLDPFNQFVGAVRQRRLSNFGESRPLSGRNISQGAAISNNLM